MRLVRANIIEHWVSCLCRAVLEAQRKSDTDCFSCVPNRDLQITARQRLAQWIEHQIVNLAVTGSNPVPQTS